MPADNGRQRLLTPPTKPLAIELLRWAAAWRFNSSLLAPFRQMRDSDRY